MTRGQKRSLVRRSHRWLGSAAALVLLLVAGSGILLQHPHWLGAVNNDPLSVAVDPADPTHLLRGTHWGVEVSGDSGQHWQEVPMLAAPTDVRRILFVTDSSGDQTVYAMGTGLLVMSDDGGRVWREVAGPVDQQLVGAEFLDLTGSPAGELNLLTSVGLYRRARNGDWSEVGQGPADERNWQQWVHDLHTGHLFGSLGRRTAEGSAWVLVLLTISGLVLHRRVSKRNSV